MKESLYNRIGELLKIKEDLIEAHKTISWNRF